MKQLSSTKVNTNNGWGFGGHISTYYYFDNGLIYRHGRFHHRHTGTSSANQWMVGGISEDYPEFTIAVHGLKGNHNKLPIGQTVYVYRQDSSYHATTKQATKSPFGWAGEYQLIK